MMDCHDEMPGNRWTHVKLLISPNMAFFKFRTGGEKSAVAPAPSESVEVMRRRARHRLIGAAVLVLIGVVGFPLLFDRQPRPIPVDIAIEIPDRNNAKLPPIPSAVAPAPAPAQRNAAPASSPPTEPAPSMASAPVVVSSTPTPKPPSVAKVEPKADESVKVQALLEARDTGSKPASGDDRYVVQVGAFADAARAREVRQKLERAGLKTYTQVAETKDGRRIRVRVGPFADRAQADRAADKVKKLELPVAVLNLSGRP